MGGYIHARLNDEEVSLLDELRQETGESVSAIIKEGLKLVAQKKKRAIKPTSVLKLAGESVGKFSSPLRDLSTNKKYFENYGH